MTLKSRQHLCPGKSEIFGNFGWINWKFLCPDSRPPDFKPDWRRWKVQKHDTRQNINNQINLFLQHTFKILVPMPPGVPQGPYSSQQIIIISLTPSHSLCGRRAGICAWTRFSTTHTCFKHYLMTYTFGWPQIDPLWIPLKLNSLGLEFPNNFRNSWIFASYWTLPQFVFSTSIRDL